MLLNNQINPTQEQVEELVRNYPKDQAVVMVNILKFKDEIDPGISGEFAYNRYAQNVLPVLKSAGGILVWRGLVHQTVIGNKDGEPDQVLLVRYPNIEQFVKMVSSEEYRNISKDRTVALVYGGLLACQELYSKLK